MRVALAILMAASFPAAATLPPPSPGQLSGVGEVSWPGCGQHGYKIPFAAFSEGKSMWLSARVGAIGIECEAAVYGAPSSFAGQWTPRNGGCLHAVTGTSRLCIGPMPDRGVSNETSFSYCLDATQCFAGKAWVARA
jgi:hypothetical protein